jgi:hypothetical protein
MQTLEKRLFTATAEATGGRHVKGKMDDQNFDSYAVEYTFPDGTKFFVYTLFLPFACPE